MSREREEKERRWEEETAGERKLGKEIRRNNNKKKGKYVENGRIKRKR